VVAAVADEPFRLGGASPRVVVARELWAWCREMTRSTRRSVVELPCCCVDGHGEAEADYFAQPWSQRRMLPSPRLAGTWQRDRGVLQEPAAARHRKLPRVRKPSRRMGLVPRKDMTKLLLLLWAARVVEVPPKVEVLRPPPPRLGPPAAPRGKASGPPPPHPCLSLLWWLWLWQRHPRAARKRVVEARRQPAETVRCRRYRFRCLSRCRSRLISLRRFCSCPWRCFQRA